MSRGDRDVVEDGDLKAIPITLPLLPSPEGRDSSLEAGDWLIRTCTTGWRLIQKCCVLVEESHAGDHGQVL